MKVNVWNTILQLSKERDVEPRIIIQAIEESLKVAAAQHFTSQEDIQVLFRPEKGELRVFVEKTVVSGKPSDESREISLEAARTGHPEARTGSTIEIDLPSETLGRIAAQAAKQVIFQKVRNAEQEKIYGQYAHRMGEIVSGIVRRSEPHGTILEVSRTEALLPHRDKLPQDAFKRGEHIKAIIIQVLKGSAKGSQIVVSRTNSHFLARLLELEIPEIANRTIEIMDVVRQPGERAKVAVRTHERDIDPIGACIGVKGNRILAISKELGGEKIDIIPWSPNPASYAKAALSPAKVDKLVITSKADKEIRALVQPGQLSLAIGKKGINVKLASRLVGWKISIQEEQTDD
jgi:transcription termination/antitermination protein NusA